MHYATLHTGEEVVVKIQRPGIRRRVAADLQILKRGAQIVELAKLGRRLSAQDVVADFADNLAEELDFRLEAQSMDAWVAHMHASPLGKNIRVPQVYWDHTSARVLTMEHVHGIRIDDAAAIRKAGFDGTDLVKALLFSVFEGGLRHGLFHGDLHAGNLYVDPDGKIVFFDFGIMGRIDPRTRWLLRELVYALLVKKDHAAAGKIVVFMGAVGTVKPEAQAAKDLEKFAHAADREVARRPELRRDRQAALGAGRRLRREAAARAGADRQAVPLRRALHEAAGAEVADDVRPRAHRLLRELHGRGQPRASPTSWRSSVHVRTGTAPSGDIEIHYEDMGDPNDPAVLLIMGLGAQLVLWRTGFCERLVDPGLRVIRYDNRDVGLSTKLQGHRHAGSLPPKMVRHFFGARNPAVYTLEHMADDAAALLDHLDVDKAHVVGASMGGMIAQIFAARHKPRTDTLAVIFSSNNQPLLPPPGPKHLLAILQKPKDSSREAIVENAIRVNKIIGSPGYPRPGRRDPRRGDRRL